MRIYFLTKTRLIEILHLFIQFEYIHDSDVRKRYAKVRLEGPEHACQAPFSTKKFKKNPEVEPSMS